MSPFLTLPTLVFVLWTACVLILLPRIPLCIASLLAGGALAVCIFIEPGGLIRSVVVGEQGGVDFSTGLVFGVASVLMLWNGVRVGGTRRRLFLLLGALFLVAAGEETSWLQLYLEYDTPEGLRGINQQGEMTLHNLVSSRVVNSAFLMGSAFLFLLGPKLARQDGRAGRAIRVYFAAFSLYLLLQVLMPRENQSGLVTLIYQMALIGSVGLWIIGPRLWNQSRLLGPLRSVFRDLRFGPGFLVASSVLFGAWMIYGVRFQCLGDLSWVPANGQLYPTNIDDELLEYFSAALCVLLARRQETGDATAVQDPRQASGKF